MNSAIAHPSNCNKRVYCHAFTLARDCSNVFLMSHLDIFASGQASLDNTPLLISSMPLVCLLHPSFQTASLVYFIVYDFQQFVQFSIVADFRALHYIACAQKTNPHQKLSL